MVWVSRILLLFVLLTIDGLGNAAGPEFDLSGTHPVMSGDDPAWSARDFDDSDWSLHPIPSVGDWQAQGGKADDLIRWQRIHITLAPEHGIDRPALLLGVLSGADRAFVNGIEVGASANIDDTRYQMRTSAWSRAWPRLYRFDADLLRTGDNVIAIRHARAVRNNAAVLAGPVLLGDYGDLVDISKEAHWPITGVSFFLIINWVLIAVVLLGGILLGFRNRAILLFALIFLPPCIAMIYLSPVVRQTGFQLEPVLDVYTQRARVFASLMLIDFVALVLGHQVVWWLRSLQIVAVGLLLIPPLNDGGLLSTTREYRFLFVLLTMLLLVGVMTTWSARALYRNALAPVLMIGLIAVFVGICSEFLINRNLVLAMTGNATGDFGMTVFFYCLALAVGLSYLDAQRRVREAQGHILNAQETERRRIARDVHDGVGQWLSTIKLNLQMLGRGSQAPETRAGFGEVVGQVDAAISDARRIAHDLSPTLIEREGLATAISSHADLISGRGNLTLKTELENIPELTPALQGHVYRIFQEAVQNALRHGKANVVNVALKRVGRQAILSVSDNGEGFDANALADDGIGLQSIRERATLLSGDCEITSQPGSGATVKITFPIRH